MAGERRTSRKAPAELSAPDAAETALGHISSLTGRELIGATSVEPTDDGWRVGVEVIEERRIPSTSDLLAQYEVDLDLTGELLAYRRARRYVRGRTDAGNGIA
ncbi:gas vesicle protein GvpO [Prauserella cavernicola]|uniref:gas vesicle protein GvpO n=1 Tax=Prauserella cavernicola TaxID=2800127 RepID=UPI0027DE5531|nr:gas vesicle protein GvpO [Prauserella cavernicola]